MKIFFWILFIYVLYTYVGYAIFLTFITLVRKKIVVKKDSYPFVSMIIAAYNEEKAIEEKIKNSLALDYPEEKLEIIVGSDASSDRTDEIVSRYRSEGIKLLRLNRRGGKTAVQNMVVKKTKGEILVFSDATTIYRPDVIKKLARNFADPGVGCVGGEEIFIKPGSTSVGSQVSLSWSYERLLRRMESRFNTMIGVSGCIFAVRKELYEPLEESLIEDFVLPLKVISRGYRVVCEPKAIGYEAPPPGRKGEFKRKTRIVAGGWQGVFHAKVLFNPFKFPLVSFQLISHKIFRWLTPLFLPFLFFSNIMLLRGHPFYLVVGLCQIAFLLLAVIGYSLPEKGCRFPKIPFYFILVNLAAFWGMIKFLRGGHKTIWEPVR